MTRTSRSERAFEAPSAATAFFLSETTAELNDGAGFLDRLSPAEAQRVRAFGRPLRVKGGDAVFSQGEAHEGIFLIEEGRIRVFYTAPSGREVTLAYWTPGHFIGGPEIMGGGTHMWSGVAIEDSRVTILPTARLHALITQMPNFALSLIEGLVAKGKCYSAMAQMLGTRSVIERLAQFLLNYAELYGVRDGDALRIDRTITHDQIAAMVGSTRQWVTMMLRRFHDSGIVLSDAQFLRIVRPDLLRTMLS
jgi:CRP/FNR family transcriptional regulator, cyclic AMP receptor protein